jgi:hypothetical protein
LALGFGQNLPIFSSFLTAEELYQGQGNKPGNLNRTLTQAERFEDAQSLTIDAQMAAFGLASSLEERGGLPTNRGNGGRGGGIEHAQVQQYITDYAGGRQEVRVYESGSAGNYRIVDNVDSMGRYHQVGDMRYRGDRYSPSADQRAAIEDVRYSLGDDATIIFHDKLGKGPTLINPDQQLNWRPAPAKLRTFGKGP